MKVGRRLQHHLAENPRVGQLYSIGQATGIAVWYFERDNQSISCVVGGSVSTWRRCGSTSRSWSETVTRDVHQRNHDDASMMQPFAAISHR